MIYFTSDLHFYHKNVIKYCDRPFESVEIMNEQLIKNWNKCVKANDEIYILGDFSFKGATLTNEVLEKLNGRKYLIKGNHDEFTSKENFDTSHFEYMKEYVKLRYQNEVFILCHYPFLEWDMRYKGSYNLHGHSHNNKEYNLNNQENKIKRFDVGVDANDFTPISIDYIIEFFK